jgi:hypothetical protein
MHGMGQAPMSSSMSVPDFPQPQVAPSTAQVFFPPNLTQNDIFILNFGEKQKPKPKKRCG